MNITKKYVFLLITCTAASSIGAMQSDATPAPDMQTSVPVNSRSMARYTKDGVIIVIRCPGKFKRQLPFSLSSATGVLPLLYEKKSATHSPVHLYIIDGISEEAVETFYNVVVLDLPRAQQTYIEELFLQGKNKILQELATIFDAIRFKVYTPLLSTYAKELFNLSIGIPDSATRAHALKSQLVSYRKKSGIKIIFESEEHTEEVLIAAKIAQRLRKLSNAKKQHHAKSEGGFRCHLPMVPVGIKLDFLKACCIPSGKARTKFYQQLAPDHAAALIEIFEQMKGTGDARRACWLGLARASQPDEASAATRETSRKRTAPAPERDRPAKRAKTTAPAHFEHVQPEAPARTEPIATITPILPPDGIAWLPVPATAPILRP